MTVAYLHIEGKGFDIAVSITRIDAETWKELALTPNKVSLSE